MTISDIIHELQNNLQLAFGVIFLLSAALFFLTRYGVARLIMNMAARSTTHYDDILVRNVHPYRVAWLAPMILIYTNAYLFVPYELIVAKVALFFILWLSIITLGALLNAINEIYEHRPSYNGVSIQSYLDLVKLATVVVGLILSITLITDESPVVLLTGLGAVAAVLMLIFQNTILSLVASIQIAANDLLKEGDWVEVPSYAADGDVTNINLHTIKIRNFDMTYSIIPTYKIVDVPYRNWRGMTESGGRRIQRSVLVDMISIKFCSREMLERLCKIDLLNDQLLVRIAKIDEYQRKHRNHFDSPLDGPQLTNIEIFRIYIMAYLKSRSDIHTEGRPFLVRVLSPGPTGLPVELYIFAKTTDWATYEGIQAEIFDHLLAAAHVFELRVFQEPTGLDFTNFSTKIKPQ